MYNGVQTVEMRLKQHLPSSMNIAGNDALISYGGEPQICYRCNETGHQRQDCPRGKRLGSPTKVQLTHTWADIVSNMSQEQHSVMSVPRKPSMRETKTKKQNTTPDEVSDKKRISTTHGTKGGSDEKCMDTIDAVENQNGHDMLEI